MSLAAGARILHLSAALPDSGAGGAALATHHSLKRFGVQSKLLLLAKYENSADDVYCYADTVPKRLIRFATTSLDRAPVECYRRKEREIFSPALFGLRLRNHPLVRQADILHLNWVNHGFIDLRELRKLRKPIVWTMHDMWPFTGGCHHSSGCSKYQFHCGACPALHSTAKNDLSTRVLRRKQQMLPGLPISWVAVSTWMADAARASALLRNAEIAVVPSGVDTTLFRPVNQTLARTQLGLPLDRQIITIGAADVRVSFKGLKYSIEALRSIGSAPLVVTFGSAPIDSSIEQDLIHLGFVPQDRMALIHSAADVFLAPAVSEAFGKAVAEAQCCGTPVVAFDETGPRDIVEHKVTGYLAAFRRADDVANGLRYCLTSRFDREAISVGAIRRFDIDECTRRYLPIYEAALESAVCEETA